MSGFHGNARSWLLAAVSGTVFLPRVEQLALALRSGPLFDEHENRFVVRGLQLGNWAFSA